MENLKERKEKAQIILQEFKELCNKHNIWFEGKFGYEPKLKENDKIEPEIVEVVIDKYYGRARVKETWEEWEDDNLFFPEDFIVEV